MSGAAGCERIATPLGAEIEIRSGSHGIEAVSFVLDTPDTPEAPNFLTTACAVQLREYFVGDRRTFDLPLAPFFEGGPGTDYRRAVWRALCAIPFGETRTYTEMAAQMGGCARSIGGANGANTLCIVIPCHRVVGKHGYGGYGGPTVPEAHHEQMLAIKQNLLAHESRVADGALIKAAG